MFWRIKPDRLTSVFPMMMLESKQALEKHIVVFSGGTATQPKELHKSQVKTGDPPSLVAGSEITKCGLNQKLKRHKTKQNGKQKNISRDKGIYKKQNKKR